MSPIVSFLLMWLFVNALFVALACLRIYFDKDIYAKYKKKLYEDMTSDGRFDDKIDG